MAFAVAIACIPLYGYIRRTAIERVERHEKEKSVADLNVVAVDTTGTRTHTVAAAGKVEDDPKAMSVTSKAYSVLMKSLNHNVHTTVEGDAVVSSIHENAEKFEPRTEAVFSQIQIFTACFYSFAHGANGDTPSLTHPPMTAQNVCAMEYDVLELV